MAEPITQEDVNKNDVVMNSPLPLPAEPQLNTQEQYLVDHHRQNLQRPVQNEDGTHSTLRAGTFTFDDKTYVLPTIWNSKQLTADESVEKAKAAGLDNFPSYGSVDEAKARYDRIHDVIANDVPGQSGAAADARHVMELQAQEKRANAMAAQQRQQGIGNYEPDFKPVGPDAQEAADTLAKWRGKAHIPPEQPLPEIYRSMATARAAGHSWEEINNTIADAKDKALAAGYSIDEVNRTILGVSLDPHTDAKPPRDVPPNVPAELGHTLREFSDKTFGPREPFTWMGLPDPAQRHTVGSMLSHLGWNTWDFAKTFPASVVTGAGATAELFDGKPRSDAEYVKLGWEASAFIGLFLGPMKKIGGKFGEGAAKVIEHTKSLNEVSGPEGQPQPANLMQQFPKLPDFIDGATGLAQKHPEGLNDNTLSTTLKALGDHYVNTGEHPVSAASNVVSYDEFMTRWENGQRAKAQSQGLKEPPLFEVKIPGDEAADAVAATNKIDKIISPIDATKLPERNGFAEMSSRFQTLMGDEDGAISLGVRNDIRPEEMFRKDPMKFGQVVNEIRAFLEPAYLSPKATEAASSTMGWSALRMEQAAVALNNYGRYVGELSSTMRYNLMGAIERGLLPVIENNRTAFEKAYPIGTPMRELADNYLKPGSPLFGLAKVMRQHLDLAYDRMDQLGVAPSYIDNYLPHIWKDYNKAKSWLQSRPLAGGKAFTKERVFGDVLEGINYGLTPATDNPINMVLVGLKSMQNFIKAHETLEQFKTANAVLPAASVTRGMIEDGWRKMPEYFGLKEAQDYYGHPDAVRILDSMTNPGFNKFSTYRLLRDIAGGINSVNLAGPGFHSMFVTLDTAFSDIGLAMQELSRTLLNPTQPGMGAKEAVHAAGSLIRAPFSPLLNSGLGIMMRRAAEGKSVPTIPGLIDGKKIAQMAAAYVEGGGRFGMSEEFRGSRQGSFGPALLSSFNEYLNPLSDGGGKMGMAQELGQMWRDTSGSKVSIGGYSIPFGLAKFTGQTFARSLDTIASPLMEHYVPWLKAGLFYRMAASAMRVAPNMGPLEQRHVFWNINRTIDNRLGEMVYDNVMWNQYVKSAGHLAFRAVGFNFGSIDTAVRGAADIALLRTEKLDMNSAAGVRQMTANASALIGITAGTAMLGAAIMYMSGTWNEDRKPIDYVFPPIDDQGTRIKLPTYANTAYEFGTHPKQAFYNRLNPMWTMLAQGLENRQWDGKTAITKADSDILTKGADYMGWMQQQLWPYSLQQYYHPTDAQKAIDPALRVMGVGPAPYDVRNPGGAMKYELRERRAAEKALDRQRAKRAKDDEENR